MGYKTEKKIPSIILSVFIVLLIRTDFIIRLPMDKTGQPDWTYMEEYMRKVEERVKATMGKYEMTVNEVAL